MSIFTKVKEMLGGRHHQVPEQRTGEQGGDPMQGMRDRAEDTARDRVGQTGEAANDKTGGRFDEQIDRGTTMGEDAADRIDGRDE